MSSESRTLEVDYQFPAGVDAAKQANIIALGQTVGTWDASFAHRESSFAAHKAEVVGIREEGHGAIATVRFPTLNTEGDIASLLTMIFGKYSMAGPAKVVAVRLPQGYGQRPKFGITGVRSQVNAFDRPLIMAIFKPALGLSAADHAQILSQAAAGGLDVIKDDEILGNLDSAPTLERWQACKPIIEETQQRTGRSLLYAVNVTGPAPVLLDRAKRLVDAGANALLLNVLAYGFSVLEALAQDPEIPVPIFAHPALAGAWCGAPDHGFSYSTLLGTLMAHAGADAVLYPAHYGSLPFCATEEARIRDALRSRNVFPVPSAGIHPGVVPRALADYGHDVILNAGTGIMDHPDGPTAGVQAFVAALQVAKPGQAFQVESMPPGPLRRALEKWGVA
ncbi:MAG TPA: RuBisCO large subunit C-terminal-like domain-containing protein [Stenomitos sp.]